MARAFGHGISLPRANENSALGFRPCSNFAQSKASGIARGETADDPAVRSLATGAWAA
jgi:hypothetical protein